ncbi:heat shock protein HSP70 [Thalassoporum mexicanum PCC 7367]|uniref:Hsp70 family protein n=1 Tax=Thalassoporum mexicanum TaxID=3457544 RepID=UPI00029FF7DE|nr:Hsp70 family protein [Pseudanabaena sp. PCC 7367]AFY68912.1 heat shock protein HSP70 [Pseudanabaena sp. PCC 7367]
MHYAIDFGTSNTVVARINAEGVAETIALPGLSSTIANNPPLIPSFVYVENAQDGKVLVGQEVRDRGLDLKGNQKEPRFFHSFKRAIGANLPGFVPELDEVEVSFESVGNWFLKRIIAQLEEPESIVFTVPVDSFEPYRQWLSDVSAELAVKQIRLLDEPTAAALGYGLGKKESEQERDSEPNTPNPLNPLNPNEGKEAAVSISDRQTILVVDFGGGTLDLALVKLNLPQLQVESENKPQSAGLLGFLLKWGDTPVKITQKPQTARVIAKAGQNLGGMDIDNWLVDYFHRQQGLPKNSLISRLAERVKITLSTEESASEVFFDDVSFNSYELNLERSQLNQVLAENQFFDRLDASLNQIKQQATRQGFDLATEIEAVLLVGGTAQMPAVRDWAVKHFSAAQVKAHKPFEAIAHGALAQEWQLKDFLYHSYGVRYWDKRHKRHGWQPIVQAGQTYPLEKPIELVLGASRPEQPSIELVIGELGETDVEVYFEGDRLVTRNLSESKQAVQPLNDRDAGSRSIANLEPPGNPGSDRIKVLFQVDEQRTLKITVEDLLTNDLLVDEQAVVQLI